MKPLADTQPTNDPIDLFSTLSIALCILDNKRKIKRCNPAMVKLFNKPEEQMVGKSFCKFLGECTINNSSLFLDKMEETLTSQTVIVQADNRWFTVTADPVVDEHGKLQDSVQCIHEITEGTRIDPAVLETHTQRTLSILAAGLCSELLNHLVSVFGFAQLALKKIDEPEKVKKYIENVLIASQQLADRIRKFRDFAPNKKSEA